MTLIKIVDAQTGTELEREMTADEQAQYDADQVIASQPKVEPTPAQKLFAATGLTVAEYKALGL